MKPILCGICHNPERPIIPSMSRDIYHRIEGWARKGQAGGSDVALREQVEGFAHADCVELRRNGIDPGQGTLA